jgi:hypothetical protein
MPARTRTAGHHTASGARRGHTDERLAALERLLDAQREELGAQRELAQRQQEQLAVQHGEIERLRAERTERTVVAPASPLILPAKLRGRDSAANGAVPGRTNGRPTSRRGLLKLGGVAAAAGLAAGAGELLRPGAAHAAPVPTNNNFILGVQNTAGSNTILTPDTLNITSLDTLLVVDASSIGMRNAIVGFAHNAQGVNGNDEAGGTGVAGNNTAAGGSVGAANGGLGVHGTSIGNWGVLGESTNIAGVAGSSTNWTGGWFAGPTAQIELVPNGVLGAPTSGQHYHGMIFVDSAATMWLCTGTGNPGTWVRMAAVPNGTLGGAVHLLPVAARLLDTRGDVFPVASHATVQFNAGGVGGIPTNATAVLGHLAAGPRVGVSCGDGSSAILWPNGQPRPGAVNVVYNNPVDTLGQCLTGTLALVAIGAGGQINLFSQPINPVGIDYLFDCFGFVM